MKSRVINILFASIAIVLGIMNAQAQTVTWTGEAAAAGSFYLYNSTHNVFLKKTSEVTSTLGDVTLFTLSAASSATISYQDNGTKYVYESAGKQSWGTTNTNKWTIASNNGGYYISHRDPGYSFGNRTRYINTDGSSVSYPYQGFNNNNRTWQFISLEQVNAFRSAEMCKTIGAGATSATWQSNISTSKENGVWVAKSATNAAGEYVKLNVSGISGGDGYYLVTVVAKKSGTSQATVMASSANENGAFLTTGISTYEIPVIVAGGNVSVFVRTYDANAGDVYAMITKVTKISETVYNEKNQSLNHISSLWIPEAPGAKEYFIFHPYTNKFLKATNTVNSDIHSSTVFTLSAATDATISYDDNGTIKYVNQSKGNDNWDVNPLSWTIENKITSYQLHSQNGDKDDRYMQYDGSDMSYSKDRADNTKDNYRTWQFISNSQYSAIYPTNYVKGLLKNNTVNVERSDVSLVFPEKDGETWLAKTTASTNGNYLTLNFTGLADGYYQVDVDVKKSGSGNATINAKGATTASKNIGTTLSTQTLSVQVTGGKLSVYVNAADKNCGNVYAAIKNIKEIVVIPDNSVFYLYNKGGQAYMEAGLNFGTTATIGSGIAFTIEQKDVANGKYTIKTQIGGSDNLGLDGYQNGPFVDIPTTMTTDVIIEAVPGQTNTYTLKYETTAGTKYVSATQGNNRVGTVVAANNNYAYWVFKTLDERKAELTNATNDKGVDATFLLKDPNFGRDDKRISSWNGVTVGSNMENGGPEENFNLSIKNKVFDIYQEVTGLPNGLYVVTMQGLRNSDSNDAELYVNEYSRTLAYVGEVNSNNDAYNQFKTGACVASLPVKVTDGKLKVGVRSSVSTGNVYVDNFTITYYGTVNESELPALADNIIKNPGFKLSSWKGDWSNGTGTDNKQAFAMQVYDTKDDYFDVKKGAYAEMRGINSQVKAGDINQTINSLVPGFYTLTADVTAINREGVLYASVENGKVYSVAHNGDRKTVSVSFYVESSVNVTVGYKHEAKTTSDVCIMAIDNVIVTKMPEPATTAFTPASMTSPWVEVTSITHYALKNPDKYLFTIWADKSNLLTLGNGTAGHQGTDYKTMTYKAVADPIADLANLWEFYKSNDKYVIASASDREHILQTSDGGSYLRYQATTPINVASGEFLISFASTNNNVRFVSDNGGIAKWDGANEVAIIKEGFSHYKLYAISRADYYAQTQKIKYNATTLTPIDVSLFLANPEGLGTSGEGSTMLGWTRSSDCTLATYEDAKFATKSGKSYFGYYSNDVKTGQPKDKSKMYQTISGLPAGYYVLSVKTDDPQTGVNLYMEYKDASDAKVTFSEALTSSIDNEVTVSGSVATDGGSLTFGIQLEDYQPHVDSKDQPDYYQLMFDKFELKYYGTDEVLAESVGNGEYYIRTNLGTDANPEYRYLEAGGEWGTSPIIGKHGFAYRLERNADGKTFAMESYIQEGTIGDYFNGKYNDRGKDISKIKFNQVHPDVNPLDYYIGFDTHKLDDKDKTNQTGGWLWPNGSILDVKASQDGSTVWQVVNELQRIKEMSGASASNPVDATFFIKDPGFGRNDTRAKYWELGNNMVLHLNNDSQGKESVESGNVLFIKGNNSDYSTDHSYHNYTVQIKAKTGTRSFDMHQTIQSPNLPMGIYRISAQGTAGSGTLELYAKDASGTELGSVAFDSKTFGNQKTAGDAFNADNSGTYRKSIEVHVKENGLVIGFRGYVGTTASYVDNVEMEYLGEKPIDPADLTDERDVYVYNVEAGAFLTQDDSKNSSTGVVTSYAIVGTTGYLWTIQPKDGETGKIAIKHGGMYLVPSSTTSTAIGLQTMVKEGDPYYWTATVDPVNPNCLVIKDEMGRLLEWNGDKAYNVLSGTSADIEPRGTRWQLYTASQYGKDRAFASTASASRLANWPIVRAARVNIKNLVGDNAIEGLSDSYTAMDAVWQNIHSSSSQIASAANEVKARIVAAQNAKKGDVRNPIDVSFLINNANLGEGYNVGWTQNSASKWNSLVSRAATINTNSKDLVNIGAFGYGQLPVGNAAKYLKQTISGLPSGTYKVAVDIRSRNFTYSDVLYPNAGDYILSATAANGNVGRIASDGPQKMTIQTVMSRFVSIDDEDDEKSLEINLQLLSGSIAFDTFKLYYCGPAIKNGEYDLLNNDSELVLKGNWDVENVPDLSDQLKDVVFSNKETLSTITVDDSNVNITGEMNFDKILTSGYNVLVYSNVSNVTGSQNIVRKETVDDGSDVYDCYSCNNLVLTYNQGVTFLSIPYGFKASNVTFNRPVDFSKEPYKTDGFQWTNIVVPFDITSRPTGIIDFYKPMSLVDWESGKTTLRVVTMNEDGTLEHNTPALIKADANILIKEKNAYVYPTSELEKPRPDKPGMNLFGNYTKKYVVGGDVTLGNIKDDPQDIPNTDGLHANRGYYTNSNKFKNGNGWFNIGAFQAFIYDGSSDASAASRRGGMSFDIEEWFNTEVTEIADVEDEEVKIEAYYSVNGIRLDAPQKGVNIVKFSNGMKKKIFIK